MDLYYARNQMIWLILDYKKVLIVKQPVHVNHFIWLMGIIHFKFVGVVISENSFCIYAYVQRGHSNLRFYLAWNSEHFRALACIPYIEFSIQDIFQTFRCHFILNEMKTVSNVWQIPFVSNQKFIDLFTCFSYICFHRMSIWHSHFAIFLTFYSAEEEKS